MLLLKQVSLFWWPKHKPVFSYCPVPQLCIPPLSELLCFSVFKAPPPKFPVSSDGSAQMHLIQHNNNNNTAAVVNQFLRAKLATSINYTKVWQGDILWCHNVALRTADEAFQGQCFLWESRTLLTSLTFMTFSVKIRKSITGLSTKNLYSCHQNTHVQTS